MTGRWAYLSDSADGCAAALQRLTLILDTAGTGPQSVALLPDRSSQILGAAAAAMLSLPAADFDPGKPAAHSIVVAYDLTKTDQDTVAALRQRTPGQIVFERATCWTEPAPRHRRRQRPARPDHHPAMGRPAAPPRRRHRRPGPGR